MPKDKNVYQALSAEHTSKIDLIATLRLIELKSGLIEKTTALFKNKQGLKSIAGALAVTRAELIAEAKTILGETLGQTKTKLIKDKLNKGEAANNRATIRADIIKAAINLNATYDAMLSPASRSIFAKLEDEFNEYINEKLSSKNKLKLFADAEKKCAAIFTENQTHVLQKTENGIDIKIPEFKEFNFTAETITDYRKQLKSDLVIYDTGLATIKVNVMHLLQLSITQQLIFQLIKESTNDIINADKVIEPKIADAINKLIANQEHYLKIYDFLNKEYASYLNLVNKKMPLDKSKTEEQTAIQNTRRSFVEQFKNASDDETRNQIQIALDNLLVMEAEIKNNFLNTEIELDTQEKIKYAQITNCIAVYLIEIIKYFSEFIAHFGENSQETLVDLIRQIIQQLSSVSEITLPNLKTFSQFSFMRILDKDPIIIEGFSQQPLNKDALKALQAFFTKQFTDSNNAEAEIRLQLEATARKAAEYKQIKKSINSRLLLYYFNQHNDLPKAPGDLQQCHDILHKQYIEYHQAVTAYEATAKAEMHSLRTKTENLGAIAEKYNQFSAYFDACQEPFDRDEATLLWQTETVLKDMPLAKEVMQEFAFNKPAANTKLPLPPLKGILKTPAKHLKATVSDEEYDLRDGFDNETNDNNFSESRNVMG